MEIESILSELEYYRERFPRAALKQALEEQERISPFLLQILQKIAKRGAEKVIDGNYMAHAYALFLLAQFREKKAYPLVVQIFSKPGEVPFELTGDIVTEDLSSILASVSCGDDGLIKSLIENPEANEYVRSAAVKSLVALVACGDQPREDVIEYFRSLFTGRLEREPSHVWDSLVLCSMDLYPGELLSHIERSFREKLVDEFFVRPKDIEKALALGKEKTLALLGRYRMYRLITDTISELESWACFRAESHVSKDKGARKIGRNEPCPCGSGRKYKKCCGQFS